jgi:hypothetical protein
MLLFALFVAAQAPQLASAPAAPLSGPRAESATGSTAPASLSVTSASATGLSAPARMAAAGDADERIATLGAALAALRSDVDAAAHELEQARRAADDEHAALQRRRRDLEARIAESELVARELEAKAAAQATATKSAQGAAQALREPVLRALRALRAHIETVPFRIHGRRERIEAVLRAAEVQAAETTLALAWPLIVEEAELLATTGRARQPIDVEGKPVVAEVAHVGPLVFWKAKDGRVGIATPSEPSARFIAVDEAEGRQRLLLFFDALRRGAARGVFLLPVAPVVPSAPSARAVVTAPGGTP